MAADHFCLKWNNYQSNMVSELDSLRSDEDLVDVTLSCDGHLLKAHKVILSACSSYFRSVFKENPCKHPVVILKDVHSEDVEALLTFVYQGVVYVSEKKLSSFLQTAELLQIRGLTGAATSMKEGTLDEYTTNQNKTNERSSVPPPPQLLTANLINTWKQQTATSCSSSKSSPGNPSSPPAIRRRKTNPNKLPAKENIDIVEANSPECSETDSDMTAVKAEILDGEYQNDEMSREESSHDNASFYDNMESDETEEENGETRAKLSGINPEKLGLSNSTNSHILSMIYNASQSPTDQTSLASGSHLAQCGNCPHCGKTYSNQSALKYHVRLMHCDLTNQFSCYLCPMSFAHRDHYKAHMLDIHKVRKTRLGRRPCPLCQKIISNKSNLLKHMRIRHSDEYNPAGCTLCGKVFKNKYSLRAHINIYHKETNPNNFILSAHSHSPDFGINNSSPNCLQNSSLSLFPSNFVNTSNYGLPNSENVGSFPLIKDHVMNQYNVSNSPLT